MVIDLLFTNAHAIPMTGADQRASTVAIEKGRVVFVGDYVPPQLAAQASEIIDLAGRTLLPGLVDAHSSLTARAAILGDVDLEFAASYREIADAMAAAQRRGLRGRYPLVIGGIVEHQLLEGRLPSSEWLDQAERRRPTLLVSYDGMAAVPNSALLAAVRASGAAVADAPARHSEVWRGEEAAEFVRWVHGRRARGAHVGRLMAATSQQLDRGATSTLCAEGATLFGLEGARRLSRLRPALGSRLLPYFASANPAEVRSLCPRDTGGCLARVHTPRPKDPYDEAIGRFVRATALGGPSHTNSAAVLPDRPAVARWLWNALKAGLQPALEVMDLGSLDTAVDALEEVLGRAKLVDVRPRIIGCLLAESSHVHRIAELGVAVTTLPMALDARLPAARRLQKDLAHCGPREGQWSLPHRALIDAGVLWSMGSAGPGVHDTPLALATLAVHHPDPRQRVAPYEALVAITSDGSRTAFDEAERGTLSLGKRADLAVFSTDPLTRAARTGEDRPDVAFVSGVRHPSKPRGLSRVYFGAFAGRLRESWGI